ncbi:membrane dipeptidase [Oikeobacillus pervagus]|uniref:Membrane dipeptidase n=1 Tax=Oikeobacillus pervagus TaxID=1325931 RepID=A0AAJ1SZU5_9BACI|nr:dipeptidase [Oikeobacillus pervagus]MDQ0214707.1 membrane dipeptidase [Oikeobacillus pervagus]
MIFDAHCDVLYQLQLDAIKNFQSESDLHVTYEQLNKVGGKVQCFAIYLPSDTTPNDRFQTALEELDLFFEKVIKPNPKMKLIKSRKDLLGLEASEIGAVLTLEGCEAIEEDLIKLRTLYHLGVRSFGLTWNNANALADGAGEKRAAGLTNFGKKVVHELNDLHVWTDVSHLSEKAFWDVIEIADFPIASHSNSYKLCPHPRNLKDQQIKALIEKNGVIGITFVPHFLQKDGKAVLEDVVQHLDYICSLGGENHVGFGSDFDGIDETIPTLSRYQDYENLIDKLHKYYTDKQVRKFLYDNFVNHFPL